MVFSEMAWNVRKLAWEQALRGSLAAGQEKKGELATMSLEFEFHLQSNKHWQTRVKCNDVIANVISSNQHFPTTFSMQIFKVQRRSCKFSFLFLSHRQSTLESLLTGYMAAGTFISGLHCMAQHLVNQLTTITPLITLLGIQYYYCLGGLLHGDL